MKLAVAAGACLLASLAAFSTVARADRDRVALTDVPKAVLDAVKAKFPRAVIKTAEKEVERGQTHYEIESTLNGRELEVTLKPNGTIVEIEKNIAVSDLPKAVSEAVTAKHPQASIRKAEEVVNSRNGEERTHYDLDLQAGGRDLDMKVAPDGKIIQVNND